MEYVRAVSSLFSPSSRWKVPVVQPYRASKTHTVVTLLQSMLLTGNSDSLPIHKGRQVTAFPPNYVHSLDSSHMLLTATRMFYWFVQEAAAGRAEEELEVEVSRYRISWRSWQGDLDLEEVMKAR